MTKDKTVTMSRELAEHLAAYASDSASAVMRPRAVEARKVLAAPIVEADGMVSDEDSDIIDLADDVASDIYLEANEKDSQELADRAAIIYKLLDISRRKASQPAPVSVPQHPFADKVISKLQRFVECCDDGQGADIGRHWFDILTHLGLLNRVQRSPGLWEMTQQGEDCLDKVKELNQ